MTRFDIRDRYTGAVLYTADIDCSENESLDVKLGRAVKIAVSKKVSFRDADLEGADLRGADLGGADLQGADLWGADLRGADLGGADLRDADLGGAKGLEKQPAQTVILPEGDLIVYKKLQEGIAKLKIPAEAKRSNATGRKCRAEYALVLELPEGITEGHSMHDPSFIYRCGEIVRPDSWSDNWAEECAPGIYFYITREEAEAHS